MTTDRAIDKLRIYGEQLRAIQQQDLETRIALGKLLIVIQDQELYKTFPMAYHTWNHFLEEGFPAITKLHKRTAYVAMALARSHALATLQPEELAAIASQGNAMEILRMEKAGEPLTKHLIEQACILPRTAFRHASGASRGKVVQLWVADLEAAKHLQAILEVISHADARALGNLADLLITPEVAAYAGGPTNLVDLLTAILLHELAEAEPLDALRQQVFKEQKHCCAHCGKVKPLELHRIVFGSHGGKYERANVEGRCRECHSLKHGIPAEKGQQGDWVQ